MPSSSASISLFARPAASRSSSRRRERAAASALRLSRSAVRLRTSASSDASVAAWASPCSRRRAEISSNSFCAYIAIRISISITRYHCTP
jgi:hypothetical protein